MNKKLLTFFCLVLNVFFSIVIVLLNKMVYVRVGFPNVTLSMIHFAITFLGLIICEKFDVFCVKDVAVKEMIPIALTFCGFVVLTNLSLEHNTIGTYQVAKMLTTPCVVVMQAIFYNKKFSMLVKLTLIPITIGVIVNFYYDIRFNVIGTIYATLGVLVTSLYQVVRENQISLTFFFPVSILHIKNVISLISLQWVSSKQKEFQMDPMQLLYYQAPLSAALLFMIVPFLEPVGNTLSHTWTFIDIVIKYNIRLFYYLTLSSAFLNCCLLFFFYSWWCCCPALLHSLLIWLLIG